MKKNIIALIMMGCACIVLSATTVIQTIRIHNILTNSNATQIATDSKEATGQWIADYTKYNNESIPAAGPDGSKTYRSVIINPNLSISQMTYADISRKILDKEDFVLYFGFPDCYYCRYNIQALANAAVETDTTLVVPIFPEDYWKEARSKYEFPEGVEKKPENLSEVTKTYENLDYDQMIGLIGKEALTPYSVDLDNGGSGYVPGVYKLSAPSVIKFHSGKAERFVAGNYLNYFQTATDESDEQLYQDYISFFQGTEPADKQTNMAHAEIGE